MCPTEGMLRSRSKLGWLNNSVSFALVPPVIQIIVSYTLYFLAHKACNMAAFLSLLSLMSRKHSVCVPSLMFGIFMLEYMILAPEATPGHCPLCRPLRGGVGLPPKNFTNRSPNRDGPLCTLLLFARAKSIISLSAYGVCQLL